MPGPVKEVQPNHTPILHRDTNCIAWIILIYSDYNYFQVTCYIFQVFQDQKMEKKGRALCHLPKKVQLFMWIPSSIASVIKRMNTSIPISCQCSASPYPHYCAFKKDDPEHNKIYSGLPPSIYFFNVRHPRQYLSSPEVRVDWM